MLNRRHMIVSGVALGAAKSAVATASPVLVELFTSQGCSSCPPADRVLSHLAGRRDVIALAFHVDYWDYIGWKDPFKSRANTQRQRDYATAFRNRSVYTPQMVFNGRVEQAVQSNAAAERILAQLTSHEETASVTLARIGRDVVIKVDPPHRGTQVWAASFQIDAETAVRRGENAGRTLRNANIVRQFRALEPNNGAAPEYVWLNADPSAGLAVCVQDVGLGPVRGAAVLTPGERVAEIRL